MSIGSMINVGCKGVQKSYLSGQLNSKDLFGFAFTKVKTELPNHYQTYHDFRLLDFLEHQPNFFILNQDAVPKVLLIGKLRYDPSGISLIEKDLAELANSAR